MIQLLLLILLGSTDSPSDYHHPIADAGVAPNAGPNTGLHETGKIYLGALDTSMLFAYASGLYVSGFLAEHSNLMGFLVMGMLGCCFSSIMYGYAYYADIHELWYFAVVMVCCERSNATEISFFAPQ